MLALTALFLLYLSVPNLAVSIRAARADGTPGVFTAQRLDCVKHPGHESCDWTGGFRSDDGTVTRTEISLYGGGRDSLRAGEQVRAIDVGRTNRVYGPGGSHEWIVTSLLLVAGLAILVMLCVRPLSRRRRPMAVVETPEEVRT